MFFLVLGLLALGALPAMLVQQRLAARELKVRDARDALEKAWRMRSNVAAGLLETVRSAVPDSRPVLDEVNAARTLALRSREAGARLSAEAALGAALVRLTAMGRNHADLRALPAFLKLCEELTCVEADVAAARRAHEAALAELSESLRTFPGLLLAMTPARRMAMRLSTPVRRHPA